MALHDGQIAEMKTGEGKTLTATLAVVLNSLAVRDADAGRPTATRRSARACTSSPSTTTWPAATPNG